MNVIIQVPRIVAGEWHLNNLCGNQRLSDRMQSLHTRVLWCLVYAHTTDLKRSMDWAQLLRLLKCQSHILFFNASSQRKQILVWLILLSHNSFCHTIFSYLNKSDSVKIISKRKKNSPQFWKTFASILPVNSYQNLLN